LNPDVVVMDIAMPELNGLEATRQVCKKGYRGQVLIFSMHESEQLIRDIFEAGARGYVLKSEAAKHLVAAVEALTRGKPYFGSEVSEAVLGSYLRSGSRSEGRDSSGAALSSREREIVQLVAEGKTSKEAARVLGISAKTVETHRTAIMQKLRIHSLAEMVRYAIRNNIIEP